MASPALLLLLLLLPLPLLPLPLLMHGGGGDGGVTDHVLCILGWRERGSALVSVLVAFDSDMVWLLLDTAQLYFC